MGSTFATNHGGESTNTRVNDHTRRVFFQLSYARLRSFPTLRVPHPPPPRSGVCIAFASHDTVALLSAVKTCQFDPKSIAIVLEHTYQCHDQRSGWGVRNDAAAIAPRGKCADACFALPPHIHAWSVVSRSCRVWPRRMWACGDRNNAESLHDKTVLIGY